VSPGIPRSFTLNISTDDNLTITPAGAELGESDVALPSRNLAGPILSAFYPEQSDTITVLRARRRLAKTINGLGEIIGYDRARMFDMFECPVRDLGQIAQLRNRGKNVGTPAFFSCSGSTRYDSWGMCRRQSTSPI
jgi:hypothetical protein